jgi:hypothetical protein
MGVPPSATRTPWSGLGKSLGDTVSRGRPGPHFPGPVVGIHQLDPARQPLIFGGNCRAVSVTRSTRSLDRRPDRRSTRRVSACALEDAGPELIDRSRATGSVQYRRIPTYRLRGPRRAGLLPGSIGPGVLVLRNAGAAREPARCARSGSPPRAHWLLSGRRRHCCCSRAWPGVVSALVAVLPAAVAGSDLVASLGLTLAAVFLSGLV